MRFISSETGIDGACKLLIRAEGANNGTVFKDDGQSHRSITTTGNSVTSTSYKKFGQSSLYCGGGTNAGTQTGITLADHIDLTLGAGNFAIALWIYMLDNDGVNEEVIFGQSASDVAAASRQIQLTRLVSPNNGLRFEFWDSGSNRIYAVTSTAVTTNAWHYLVFNRIGNNIKGYVDGAQVGSTYDATGKTLQDASGSFGIGRLGAYSGAYFYGYIDNFRMYKGVAIDGTIVPTRSLI